MSQHSLIIWLASIVTQPNHCPSLDNFQAEKYRHTPANSVFSRLKITGTHLQTVYFPGWKVQAHTCRQCIFQAEKYRHTPADSVFSRLKSTGTHLQTVYFPVWKVQAHTCKQCIFQAEKYRHTPADSVFSSSNNKSHIYNNVQLLMQKRKQKGLRI